MRISSKAWHLRLVRWVWHDRNYRPPDLCIHFWAVAGSLLCVVSGIPLMLIVFVVVGPFYGLFILGRRGYRARSRRHGKHTRTEPNLVWEFIKAKKRHMCPLIEVVEERA